jgi:hypothetical protein
MVSSCPLREIEKYESEIKSIEKKIENLGVYREKFIEINKEEDKRKFTLEKAKAVVRCRSIDRSIEQDKTVKELSKGDRKLLKEKFELKSRYGIEMTDKDLGQKKEIGRIDRDNYYKSLSHSRDIDHDRGISMGF